MVIRKDQISHSYVAIFCHSSSPHMHNRLASYLMHWDSYRYNCMINLVLQILSAINSPILAHLLFISLCSTTISYNMPSIDVSHKQFPVYKHVLAWSTSDLAVSISTSYCIYILLKCLYVSQYGTTLRSNGARSFRCCKPRNTEALRSSSMTVVLSLR